MTRAHASFTLSLYVIAALAAAPAAAQNGSPAPPTVTVAEFETNRTGWVPPPHFGTTIADLLGDRLVASGKYRVLDQYWLLQPDNQGDPARRASAETLRARAEDAGVNYVVLGSVTRFSTENKQRTVGGLIPILLHLPVPIAGGARRTRTESVLSLTVRVLDVRSGELVTTATGDGAASRQDVRLIGLGGVAAGPLAGGLSSSVSGSRDALLAEAVQHAVATIGEALIAAAPRLTGAARVGTPSASAAPPAMTQ